MRVLGPAAAVQAVLWCNINKSGYVACLEQNCLLVRW
jgi:hypothetical protein